ncbi:MAG: hypothetical protein AABW67_05765 [Nanoarchaeota archaeon]
MKNKMQRKRTDRKAWIRIVEVLIAILIITGAVLVTLSKQDNKKDISNEVYQTQRDVLEIISKNESLRNEIISGQNTQVNNTILKMIPATWNFDAQICNLNDICNSDSTPLDKEVYVSEVMITTNLTQYKPQKLRFFVWMK